MNSSAHQNDHVQDLAMDYVEGRLDPDLTDEVRQHLRRCDDCRADFDHAAAMRGSAIETGLRHIHSHRMIELSDGAHASVEENAHLDSCETCHRELKWATDLELPAELAREASASGEPGGAPQAARGMGRIFALPRLFQWGSVLGAAAALLLILQPWGTDNSAIVQMAEFRALPVVEHGNVRGDETPFDAGTAAYARADYAAARNHLAQVTTDDPSYAEAQLYLGSAALLLGDVAGGRRHLETSLQNYDATATSALAALHYLLANAHLQNGDADAARTELTTSIQLDGIFSDDARAQLEALDAVH